MLTDTSNTICKNTAYVPFVRTVDCHCLYFYRKKEEELIKLNKRLRGEFNIPCDCVNCRTY